MAFSTCRLLESDAKSLNSLTSGHSRKSSSTSLVSVASADSGSKQNGDGKPEDEGRAEEDVWQVWGTVVNEWDVYFKKKNGFVKVRFFPRIDSSMFVYNSINIGKLIAFRFHYLSWSFRA